MTLSKRLLDLLLALVLCLVLGPVLLLLLLAMAALEGRPFFYVSERMKTPTQPFNLFKLRTMRIVDETLNTGVSGGDKANRITTFGRFLRKSRLDELPQLLNVLRGDMSFVGPRPPLRRYVEKYPEIYGQVLMNRPGITGIATLRFHTHEERLISTCKTAAQTEAVYERRCIPRKARLDLIYQANRSLCFDLQLIVETGIRAFRRKRTER